jgi:hypothetical protein
LLLLGLRVQYEGGKSVNLKRFEWWLDQGVSDSEAAFETWSGKRARDAGYNKVQVFELPEGDGFKAIFTKEE